MSSSVIDLVDEEEEEATEGPPEKKQKKSFENTIKKCYETFIKSNSWLSPDYKLFSTKGTLVCMACNSALKVVQLGFDGNGDVCRYKNDGHNLAKHTETIHHKNNIIKFLNKNKMARITSHFPALKDTASFDHYKESTTTLQVMTTSSLIALGMNPHQLQMTFNGSDISDAIAHLQRHNISFSTEYKIKKSIDDAISWMDNSITKMLKDEPLAIITDSASLKNDSATAILASCAKFKQPILLEVLFSNNKSKNEENDVYSADLFAQDLQRTMNTFGINISTQVVCHMGDNVVYNKAVSNNLGLPQGKCYPHALALIVKNAFPLIPNAITLIVKAGAIITAGGGRKRIRVRI
jgi:hypothetical protein